MTTLVVRTVSLPGGRAAPGYRGARSALLASALRAVGLDLGDETASLQRRCPTCGSADHGKPEVPAALAAGWHVSVAHTATRLAVAVADAPCGIDVEDVDAVGRSPVARVLLAPDEPPPDGRVPLARTWVRKEALLKATGNGLSVDPALLVLGPGHGAPRLVRWDGPGRAPVPTMWHEEELPATSGVPDAPPHALLSAVAVAVSGSAPRVP